MMGAVQEYLDQILEVFDKGRFFETTPISKKLMIDCLLKQMEANLDAKGDFYLSEDDILAAYNNAINLHIDESITNALDEGLIEITGVDPNGELTYGITESGRKELSDHSKGIISTGKFEQIGPYGPFCLN